MALFKCKMCGGALEVTGSETVATCEYCGTQQTLPKTTDDVISNLFNRANSLRLKCEFDKAAQIYEKIVEQDDSEAEAHWGIVLCKYGIEYVEDPKTFKRIPTCHRTLFEAVTTDTDYLAAIDYSDAAQQGIYESEARAIDRIQKDILAIVKNEKPFDVFICYKETDVSGKRTVDSVIANDIYHQLTQEGFKVFFARITLEDKLGQQYEPYIFAALNSAKVMVVIGTEPEHFNAVWVKNEWSRYLDLMKQDKTRLLIPCYRDMDAYDIPDELSMLQSQDMTKIGFMQDLIRGIKKVLVAEKPQSVAQSAVDATVAAPGVSSLLERGKLFLEDGAWSDADAYFDRVLDIDPKYAPAYIGKLCAELRVPAEERLASVMTAFSENGNFKKAVRFADAAYQAKLLSYDRTVLDAIENARAEGIYSKACAAMRSATNEKQFMQVAASFESIAYYKDAAALAQVCLGKAEIARKADRLEKERQAEIARKEAERIAKRNKKIAIITTPIVCAIIAFIIVLNTVIIPNGKYNDAIALMNAGNVVEAYEALVALDGYKDSADKANSIYAQYNVEKLKVAKAGDYVFFGEYEQDNNTANGKEDIEWLVLVVIDGKALVISKYALDCKPYNTSYTDVTWETCTLRKWLNNDFINAAFSAEEKAMIPTVTVSADKNPAFNTNPGNATQDQVFLLSITEANKYFSSDSAKQCKPTDYAGANGAWESDSGNCWWWLRSPGFDQYIAAYVYRDGAVYKGGNYVDLANIAVRPALWIDLNS